MEAFVEWSTVRVTLLLSLEEAGLLFALFHRMSPQDAARLANRPESAPQYEQLLVALEPVLSKLVGG